MNIFLYNILALNIPYYYNPNIHNFGNVGLGGKIHANLAYQATKFIDNIRYNGKNIRSEIYEPYLKNNKTILDLCCGIGISTPPGQMGIDTSKEMLEVAKKTHSNTQFYFGNAETFRPKVKPGIVTCMFAFHEMPLYAQIRVINIITS